jgi:hypothetical protein
MSLHHFDAADASRFLNPSVFYVGASYGGCDCQLIRFIQDEIWENGYIKCPKSTSTTDLFEQYMETMNKGDILLVKRLNGKASTTMRIMAVGIVLGKNIDKTVRVAWVMPQVDLVVPLITVGTVSPGYSLSQAINDPVRDTIEKARIKFLRLNLHVEDRKY